MLNDIKKYGSNNNDWVIDSDADSLTLVYVGKFLTYFTGITQTWKNMENIENSCFFNLKRNVGKIKEILPNLRAFRENSEFFLLCICFLFSCSMFYILCSISCFI